ncbi:MAG: 4'-phosphopantetheinyl transferase superfamily protein [Lachnospiraceae bacterium]|nr:4'-phosphopantetheinyl transferase superfamily protein [Lachnospiraceae bacterium]
MIKIYSGDIGTIDRETADRLLACLGAERKERVTRYKRERDRLLGIGAGALLSLAVSERLQRGGSNAADTDVVFCEPDAKKGAVCGAHAHRNPGADMLLIEVDFSSLVTDGFPSPAELETGKGEHGKPYLKRHTEFHYNLSHSGTKVMLACSDSEIGCDIEKIGPVRERVVKKAFAPAERAYVDAAEGTERDRRFTEVWTRKESFLKASGTGIDRVLGTFSVIGEDGQPVKTIVSEEGQYDVYCPAEVSGYECFLCVKRG